jgi:hypothetical protein
MARTCGSPGAWAAQGVADLYRGSCASMTGSVEGASQSMVRDFNDLRFFTAVVLNRGFSAAARTMKVSRCWRNGPRMLF